MELGGKMKFELIVSIINILVTINVCTSTKKCIWNRDKLLYLLVCLLGINYALSEIIDIVKLYK